MKSPFIKLLASPKGKYVYDVGKNEILRISEHTFYQLKDIMNNTGSLKQQEPLNNPEISELLSDGYLSDARPVRIWHPLTGFVRNLLNRKLEKITLQITQDCNFRCDYCIYSEEKNKKQRAHSKSKMTFEVAKTAIDFYVDHSQDSDIRNIGFYGGEPLLEFPLIKQIVSYAESRMAGRLFSMNITTNGSLLTDQVVQFLNQHKISVLLSLDGTKEAQDKHRRFYNGNGTYNAVVARLEKIRATYPEFYKQIHINSVISPENDVDDVCNLARELGDIPWNNYRVSGMTSTDDIVIQKPEALQKSEYHKFLAYLSIAGLFPEKDLSPVSLGQLKTILSSERKLIPCFGMTSSIAPGGPCIPGKARLFVSTTGDLFPCERVNESEHMRIGSLSNGFDFPKVEALLNIGRLTEEKCKNCWALRLCSICAQACDDGTDLSASEKILHCSESQYVAESKLRTLIFLYEIKNGI